MHVRNILLAASFAACFNLFDASIAKAEKPFRPRLSESMSEAWRWREYPELRGRGLRCLEEARDGAMWFGVDGGALRYDGMNWTEFDQSSGLPSTVTGFAKTSDEFYACTRSAVYAFRNEEWTEVFPCTKGLVWIIEDLMAASDESLWVATNWGAVQIRTPIRSGAQDAVLYAATQVAEHFDDFGPSYIRAITVETPEQRPWSAGIGAYVYGPIASGQTVIALAEEGPAAQAGLRIGDQILAIDGALRQTVFQNELETDAGINFSLTIRRPGETDQRYFEMTSAELLGSWATFRPYSMAEGPDGTIWFATRLGKIISLRSPENQPPSWRHHTNEFVLPSIAVPSLTATVDGVAGVGRSTSTTAMLQYDGKEWAVRELKRAVGASIISLQDGRQLIGSDGALITVNSANNTVRPTKKQGIMGNDIVVKQTADGAIWVAGKGATALRVEPQGKTWTSYEGLVYQGTSQDGSEWFITNRLTVVRHRGDRWSEFGSEDGLMSVPMTLLPTSSGDVWAAGSHQGVAATARLEGGEWQLKEHPRLSWAIASRNAFEDGDGRMWFGAASDSDPGLGGVIRYDGSAWTHLKPTNCLTFTYQACQTFDGSTWFSGPSLVRILPNDRFGPFAQRPGKPLGYCECCAVDSAGSLWVGTRDYGLAKLVQLPDERWESVWFDETKGIPNNRIRSVLPLDDGSVICHTPQGFDRYDGQSWSPSALPQQLASQLDFSGIHQAPDGAIWLNRSLLGEVNPTNAKSGKINLTRRKGFRTVRYEPDRSPPDTQLESKVTEILVGDDAVFSWSGVDLWRKTEPSQLTFSWRFDSQPWSPFTLDRVLKRSGLAAGLHRLEVRSRDGDFNVDITPATIEFMVLPQLQDRLWFRGLILVTVGLVGIAVVQTSRLFHRGARLSRANQELIAAEQRLQTANLVLKDRVKERTEELGQSNQRLLCEIAERASTESRLRDSELRYRLLVQILPDGVQRNDLQGRITYSNAMHAKMHGCTPEDLVGRYIWDFDVTPEKRKALKDYFGELIVHQPTPTLYESRNRTVDGRLIDVEVIWAYERDLDDQLVGFVSVISDVSERKRAEALIRAENALLKTVAKSESELRTLERFVEFVEAQVPEVIASVLLLDETGTRLKHLVKSNLPIDYLSAIDGVRIGEAVGSCGTAAFRGEPVFVSDIATDPLWSEFRELAKQCGLAACWSTPIKDSGGKIVGTFAIYRREPGYPSTHEVRVMETVTHLAGVSIGRSRSQKALQDSEQRFRTIFEQAAVGAAQVDTISGKILRINNKYADILGMSATEIVGKTWMDLTHPDDLAIDLANVEQLIKGEISEFSSEKRLRRKDGSVVWIDLNVAPMWQPGEEATEHIAIVQDITQRKMAYEERERRHQTLVTLDEIVRQLFVAVRNRESFFESVCRDIESLINVDLCAVPFVDEGGASFTYQAAKGRNSELLLGMSIPISDGGLCGWVIDNRETLCVSDLATDARVLPDLAKALDVTSAIVTPLIVEEKVIGGLSVFRREEAFTDFELSTLNLYARSAAAAYENWLTLSSLEARVARRTEELAETNSELESFARTVSHDLRAPLRAMEGFAFALAEDYGHQVDEEGQEFIQHIIDSAKRLDGLVSDLFAYSRLGRTELRIAAVGLNDILEETLASLAHEIESRNANIRVECNMPSIMGHKSSLVQAVTNLVSNGLKFVPEGTRPELQVWADSPVAGTVRLTIRDNGIGIEKKYQKQIFQVFKRLHGVESFPGTGIGLAIVARVCERLGGSYGLESVPGEGSHFWLQFPQGCNRSS